MRNPKTLADFDQGAAKPIGSLDGSHGSAVAAAERIEGVALDYIMAGFRFWFCDWLGSAGLGRWGLDATGGFDSIFSLEANTGRGFVTGLFGRGETGEDGLAFSRLEVLLATTCRAQFRCRAGLSAQASM